MRGSTWLSIILLIALLVRVVGLSNTPDGFHADEASYLVNTVSILETGRDEDGQLLAPSLHSLIDPKPALFSYLQAPFVALLGPTHAAARLPSAVLGVISLFIIYRLFSVLGEKKVGLIVITLLAISPWHIAISRGTQEVISSFVFFTSSLYFLLAYLQSKKLRPLILFFVTAFLSMYLYHSAKVVLPLISTLVAAWFLYQKKLSKNAAKGLLVGMLAMVGLSLLVQNSSIRLHSVSIFSSPQPIIDITEQTYAATPLAPLQILRIFYNKPHFYGREIINQYVTYFSPSFLFFDWSAPSRYSVPFHGLFYLIEIPLLVGGIYLAIARKRKEALLMTLLLIIAPLPATITSQEVPSTIRSFIAVLPVTYFIALAVNQILSLKIVRLRRAAIGTLIALYLISFSYFVMQYGIQQKVYQPWYRNSPYEAIAAEIGQYADDFDRIVVTSDLRPLYAYLVLSGQLTVADLQAQPFARDKEEYQLGKYIFSRSHCRTDAEWSTRTLYVMEIACLDELKDKRLSILDTITYRDGVAVYAFVSYTN
ncbi:glycosyltransferase family 39 protein [Candidatus Woesebacteria bacterium]|nr:glycosyltransferase family 39 protein [Candidatus Woesebacteria bacterium]